MILGTSRAVRVYAYPEPVDLRKGYDGLFGLVKQGLGRDPLSGDLFLFVNARRKGCKVLVWDGTGLCIFQKRLEHSRFAELWRDDGEVVTLTSSELALFIDHSQMHFLESMMWNRGYLSADQMAGAFQLLRSNDLIWSRLVRDYLMGERTPMIDLMAWNADSTRMPYKMHAEYLQRLYLDNELAAGRFIVDGHPAALQNIRVPMFVVGTERDHVAPWRSVYKIHYLSDTDVTFALTSGGHNAGIVSEPGRGTSFSIVLPLLVEIHGRSFAGDAGGGEAADDARDEEGRA